MYEDSIGLQLFTGHDFCPNEFVPIVLFNINRISIASVTCLLNGTGTFTGQTGQRNLIADSYNGATNCQYYHMSGF